jgi:hypothetical protein
MPRSLDDMLSTLSATDVGSPSPDLEAAVWSRIAAEDAADSAPTLRIQLAVAAATLVIGLSVGWSATTTDHPNLSTILSQDYAQYGPLSRLTGGL